MLTTTIIFISSSLRAPFLYFFNKYATTYATKAIIPVAAKVTGNMVGRKIGNAIAKKFGVSPTIILILYSLVIVLL